MNIISLIRSQQSKRLFISVIDQLILSAVNFLLSFSILKIMNKAEYGIYNIIIPISLIFTAIQNALINTPMMVEYWNKDPNERNSFVASLLIIQILFLSGILMIIIILTLIFIFTINDIQLLLLIYASIILIIGLLFREFLRNYFFTIEKPDQALTNDFFFLLLILFLFLLFFIFGLIKIEIVLVVLGLSSFLSSISKNLKLIIHKSIDTAKRDFEACYQYGKWAILGVIVTHIQTYGYLYIVGLFFSVKDVGDLSAVRLLFVPFSFILIGYSKIAIPRGSKLFAQKETNKFFKEELILSLLLISLIFIFGAIIHFVPYEIIIKVLKKEYSNSLEYLTLFTTITALSVFSVTGSNGLQSMKEFKILTKINTISMFTVLICTLTLINIFSIKGALYSIILGQIVNSTGMWYFFYKLKTKTSSLSKITIKI